MAYAATVVAFLAGMVSMFLFMKEQPVKAVVLIITGALIVEVMLAMPSSR